MKKYIGYRIGGVVVVGIAATYLYLNRPEADAARQWTNDAYIQADFTNVASRISGVVDDVLVADDQWVTAGELLAVLDSRDFKVAADQARAVVKVSEATVNSTRAQIDRQNALIKEARATVDADEAALTLANSVAVRQRQLAKSGSATVQALEQAESSLSAATAVRESHRAGLDASTSQRTILRSELEGAVASLERARVSLDEALLKLSYTRLTAPISGVIGQKGLRKGAFVATGTTLVSIVPLDQIYVRANYRETQLARVRAGQQVSVEVDALPGTHFKGTVESIGPASGLTFAPISPQNATGNFTKIVQRLPGRIKLSPNQASIDQLRVGMSVVPEISID
jgi:membrane fusion protein (multidrug efflux system)